MFERTEAYWNELTRYAAFHGETLDALRGRRVLITGAAGLIGTFLADLLLAGGSRLCLVDLDEDRLTQRFGGAEALLAAADATDPARMDELFDFFRPEYVVHAASNTSPADYAKKPVETMETNVLGTAVLLKNCVKYAADRFLFCSSVEAYGQPDGGDCVFDERFSGYVDCNTLRAGYPSAKRACEALCNAYAGQFGVNFVTARIGRIYGPTVIPTDAKAPTQFIRDAALGRDITLKSAGTQVYSYGYVADCAAALALLLVRGEKGGAYNVADSGSQEMLRDFAGFCAEAAGTQLAFETGFDLAAGGYSNITRAVMDTAKLEALGFRALTHAREGVANTVRFLRETHAFEEDKS